MTKKNRKTSGLFRLPRNRQEKEDAAGQSGTNIDPFRKKTEFKSDLKRYHDQDGLSVSKLNLGYWFLKNRNIFYYVLIVFLASISIITWSVFFYHYGSYALFGWRYDNQMLSELAADNSNLAVLRAQAPLPLKISPAQAVLNHAGNYDFALLAENPNPNHYGRVAYHVTAGDKIIGRGQSLFFPGEKKHLIILDKEMTGAESSNWRFHIDGFGWNRLSRHIYPDWEEFYKNHMDIQIHGQELSLGARGPLSEKMVMNNLRFNIHNLSAYNYWQVDLGIILINRGRIIGVNFYQVSDFFSGEDRLIEITWPGNLSAADEIIIEPTVNILDRSLFINFQGSIEDVF